MIAFAEKHPGAELFNRVGKSEIMYYLLAYNEEAFIDWSTGKCSFDSDEFKNLLIFANSFPSEFSDEDRGYKDPERRSAFGNGFSV